MLKFEESIWGIAGFLAGAVLSGGALGAIGHSSLLPPSNNLPIQAPADSTDAFRVLPQRIIASEVKADEIEQAISSFAAAAQRKIRKDVADGKYGLLWLTAWDWDVAQETGNTI